MELQGVTTTPTCFIRGLNFHAENVSCISFITVINIKVHIFNRNLVQRSRRRNTLWENRPTSGHHARYLLVYNSLPGGQSQRVKHT
jgi:hypothetical protein